jgi:glycosyltransferase involved in cell wall biosynthesis
MLVSVVIRTLNEATYLDELLRAIGSQIKDDFDVEVVIIDSGSTDGTLSIAENHGCRITFITKEQFTFGRSLNMGSDFARGDILVYVSGHCIPSENIWLMKLIKPICDGNAGYTYGRQIGRDTTKYSEEKIFEKYFPFESKIPQNGFFCNNANSAIDRKIWSEYKFDEQVTGLEDMELAKRYCDQKGKVAYVAEASVYHIHNETWSQSRRRYEREAIALQLIMPEVQIRFFDMLRYIWVSIISDSKAAAFEGCFVKEFIGIIKFRFAQFTGSFRGNHEHRALSKKRKENYFYPAKKLQD